MTGISGIVASVSVLAIEFGVVWYRSRNFPTFGFDLKGIDGSFEPLLSVYMRAAEVLITLAAGSIVLLVGSLAWHGTNAIPWNFAAPLFMLVFTVIYAVLFSAFLAMDYERSRQESTTYTRFKFCRVRSLGYGALTCFCFGYFYLIAGIAR